MEDLIATISGGMHVGKQANDLKDLQVRWSPSILSFLTLTHAADTTLGNSVGYA